MVVLVRALDLERDLPLRVSPRRSYSAPKASVAHLDERVEAQDAALGEVPAPGSRSAGGQRGGGAGGRTRR